MPRSFLDYDLAVVLNKLTKRPTLSRFFAAISRLGDGPIWYALLIAIPIIYGKPGIEAAVRAGACAIVGVLTYSGLKMVLRRPRPFQRHENIAAAATVLDEYSFPSGHTLHAVAFAVIFGAYIPATLWLLVPFAILTGMSRIILGLHYPSDVLVGGLIGAGLATIALLI